MVETSGIEKPLMKSWTGRLDDSDITQIKRYYKKTNLLSNWGWVFFWMGISTFLIIYLSDRPFNNGLATPKPSWSVVKHYGYIVGASLLGTSIAFHSFSKLIRNRIFRLRIKLGQLTFKGQ